MTTRARTRRSAKEWKTLVSAWRRSGLTTKVFAEREGLSPATLSWWRWRLGSEPAGSATSLVPVTIIEETGSPARPVDGESRWEVRVGRDLSISMSGPSAVEGLAVALRALERGGR